MIFVSIAQKDEAFASLQKVLDFATRSQASVDGKRVSWQLKKMQICATDDPCSEFEHIEAEFSGWLTEDDVTVLVSEVSPMKLNPLLPGMDSLLAMLVLTFPEVHWFFGTIRGYGEDNDDKLKIFHKAHGLHHLFQPLQASLFDGAGLRDWVRSCAVTDGATHLDAAYLSRRMQLAVAMDEESDYAHLHAYTVYRFGFRALAISRRDEAGEVLDNNSLYLPLTVVLEDLFLNFPDGKRDERLSDLCKRCRNSKEKQAPFPLLEDAEYRILVTSGQRVDGDADKKAKNKQYIVGQRAKGKKIQFLYKPHAGIFSIWEKSGLDRKLRWSKEGELKVHQGTGKHYVWPPDWPEIEREKKKKGNADGLNHSSPGIFLLIARHLLNRAESMLANGLSSVEEAVHGAVLANEALELLGGKTPTTAAEALSLKHQFELHAECQFTGVEHHVPLHHRLKEIKRDAESIARWFRPQERRRAALNIQMNIVNQLVRILRQYNQFDEEQECMNRARHLHNSLYLNEHSWRRFLTWPILRYSEFLLSSFSRFSLALILWIGGLTWLFSLKPEELDAQSVANNFQAFGIAMKTFLGNDLITSYGFWSVGLSVLAILAGLAHLGIFISHLYVLVSKR